VIGLVHRRLAMIARYLKTRSKEDTGAITSKSCVVTNPIDVSDLWSNGAFGSSTRSNRYKPAFLSGYTKKTIRKQNKKQKAARAATPLPNSKDAEDGSYSADIEESDGEYAVRDESMQLNLMETMYLKEEEKRIAEVSGLAGDEFGTDGSDGEPVSKAFEAAYADCRIGFDQRYRSYKQFRTANWIPKNGSQYGCDFVLYRNDPDRCHSRYCVTHEDPAERMPVLGLFRSLRVAEQTRKRMVISNEDGLCVQFRRWVLKHEQAIHTEEFDGQNATKKIRKSTSNQNGKGA
jgi:tRNA-intron lyase